MATGGIDVSDETFDFLCNGCQENDKINRRAVDYCKKCNSYFCEACLKSHNKIPYLKDHRGQLIGRDHFRGMSRTRLQPASSTALTSNDVIFGCHTCAGDNKYKLAIDFCTACSEYLCEDCLKKHNKWTDHSDKLLGIADLGQMIDARLTLTRPSKTPPPPKNTSQTKQQRKEEGARPKKPTSFAVPQPGPANQSRDSSRPVKTSTNTKSNQSSKAHGAVDGATPLRQTHPTHGEVDGSTQEGQSHPTHGEVDGSTPSGQSHPTHGQVDGAHTPARASASN